MMKFFQPKFRLVAGVIVPNLNGVTEGFSLQRTNDGYSVITINVSAEKLQTIYLGLCELVSTPAFAIVEIPTKKDDEIRLRKNPTDPFHNDVYCSDNMFFDAYKSMFLMYSKIFIDDGGICFGFSSCTGDLPRKI